MRSESDIGSSGDVEITWHSKPVIEDERSLEALASFHPSYGRGYEKTFVSEARSGKWKLVNIPYYVYGLKAGSIVTISEGQIVGVDSLPNESAWRLRFRTAEIKESVRSDESLRDVAHIEPMFGLFVAIQAREGCEEQVKRMVADWFEKEMVQDYEDVMSHPFDPGEVLDDGLVTEFRVWNPDTKEIVPSL